MMDWKNIATAPKDGTRILITNGEYVVIACFGSWTDADEDWTKVDCWSIYNCEDPFYSSLRPENWPTHWMELPEPVDEDKTH